LKAIIISLPHRAGDAVRHNPNLIRRTIFIDNTAVYDGVSNCMQENCFKLADFYNGR